MGDVGEAACGTSTTSYLHLFPTPTPRPRRLVLRPRKSSPTLPTVSSFDSRHLLPDEGKLRLRDSALDPKFFLTGITKDPINEAQPASGAPFRASMSARGSVSPPSVFDQLEDQLDTEPTTQASDEPSYDLKPPPPSVSHDNIESLALRFFSSDHLDVILQDVTLNARFTKFINEYRPQHAPSLAQYLETKKAILAVQYANAIADHISTVPGHPRCIAATLDDRFEAKSKRIIEDLVEDALTAYLTHRLVQLVTDTLVKEITGNSAPIMRELIPSLAEVYCVTDPSLPDNPIVYASEEFYNTTQYGREYTIGRNCRFLQGPKTSNATVRRLIDALTNGQEICETILNYRRDGSPFMNLLMLAPLYDNKGQVRYFLGCQIDVSQLIEGGRGLESFSQLLAQDRTESRFGGRAPPNDPKHVLGELGQLLTEEESNIIRNRSRRFSEESRSTTPTHKSSQRTRRILGMDDTPAERALWPHPSLGPSGRLPGVYQNYLLVRPYPSLRITFTSPALRIPGLLQTKFLDRIGGPEHVREGILDALSHGTSVTAKISWLTHSASSTHNQGSAGSMEGKQRWIHCTPLLGSDERVGVWMVVMVENEEVTGQLNRHLLSYPPQGPSQTLAENSSIIPASFNMGAASPRFNGNKLYAEYLRRESTTGKTSTEVQTGGPGGSQFGGSQRSGNGKFSGIAAAAAERERREVDDQFKDF